METGEISHFEQFHLFPQCFAEAFFFNAFKRVYVEEKVNMDPCNLQSIDQVIWV